MRRNAATTSIQFVRAINYCQVWEEVEVDCFVEEFDDDEQCIIHLIFRAQFLGGQRAEASRFKIFFVLYFEAVLNLMNHLILQLVIHKQEILRIDVRNAGERGIAHHNPQLVVQHERRQHFRHFNAQLHYQSHHADAEGQENLLEVVGMGQQVPHSLNGLVYSGLQVNMQNQSACEDHYCDRVSKWLQPKASHKVVNKQGNQTHLEYEDNNQFVENASTMMCSEVLFNL